jgi:hypothetical protein
MGTSLAEYFFNSLLENAIGAKASSGGLPARVRCSILNGHSFLRS